MKYTINSIKERFNTGEKLKYVFFWGDKPTRDGKIGKSCLSQWWISDFTVDGTTYSSAEHWMMAKKAKLFDDEQTLEKILLCKSPAEAKKLGRQVKDFDPLVWDDYKFEIVKTGNVYKFQKNETLKDYLLKTKNRVLVEASPYDKIWGIGKSQHDPGVENPHNWDGENLLGFALMEVRDELLFA